MSSLVLYAKYVNDLGKISSHYHDCCQILYVTEGSAIITVGGRSYHANTGTLILISRFEHHSVQITEDTYSRFALRISPRHSESTPFHHLLSLLVNRPQNFCHALHLPEAEDYIQKIVSEWNATHPMRETMLDLMLYELLILISRSHPELLPEDRQTIKSVSQVQQYLQDQYQTRITLEYLSQEFHISQSYLCHQFKLLTGQSVMGYLTSCRLAAAKQQLSHTSDSITKVMTDCGFSDSSNFSRTFKAYTGYTPTDFRLKYGR